MSEDKFIDLPSGKVVIMGSGDFAVGGAFSPDLGMHCLMYLPLPERREPGTDTTDIFPVGSRADNPAALIYFKTPGAIRQTMGYLAELLAQAEGKVSSDAMMTALDSVIHERVRQVQIEGWTPEHDDEHADGQLAAAAGCYALFGCDGAIPPYWPWANEWWKPADRRRNLVKACALGLSEIERLDRAEAKQKGGA